MLTIVNETTKRFPRTLVDAFPDSEGYRDGFELPREEPPLTTIFEGACWLLAIALLSWVAWAALHASTPGPL